MHAFDDEEDASIFERYERMLKDGHQPAYFDVEDLELIIDHFFIHQRTGDGLDAIDFGMRLHPNAITFPLRRARLELFEGSEKIAKLYIDKAQAIHADYWEVFLLLGYYWSGKNSELAIEYFQKAKQSTTDLDEQLQAVNALAAEYQMVGLYQQAIDNFSFVLSHDPDDEMAMLSISVCFDYLRNVQGAISFFEGFIEKEPYSETAWFHLGVNYSQIGAYKKAVTAFDFAVVIDEYFTAAYYEKSRCQELLEDWDGAISTLERCAEIEEESSFTTYKIGSIYSQIGQLETAKRYFYSARTMQPNMPEPAIELALLLASEGQIDEAIALTLHALDVTGWNNPDFLTIAIDFFISVGDRVQLKEVVKSQIQTGEMVPEQLKSVIDFYFEKQDYETGLLLLRKGKKFWGGPKKWEAFYAGAVYTYKDTQEGLQLILKSHLRYKNFVPLVFSYFPSLSMEPELQRLAHPPSAED
ncbi:MAG: tetratricopeptide repeat protein [Schleiferiaceae bacterium]|nr:tetratricopeptide repeat protein [Schleiferiaceae bacterium]